MRPRAAIDAEMRDAIARLRELAEELAQAEEAPAVVVDRAKVQRIAEQIRKRRRVA